MHRRTGIRGFRPLDPYAGEGWGKAEDYPGGAPVDAVYYPHYPQHPLWR